MEKQYIPIPDSNQPRIVILGGGFGGLRLARDLSGSPYQVVLLDKNNYHQFQPLFYQVAMSGLEPSSIVFPLRKVFQKQDNIFFRTALVEEIDTSASEIRTDIGYLRYDHLVLAIGADTNFFGNQEIARKAIPMKSVSEALFLRNRILEDLETALNVTDYDERQSWIDIVIVGGGPTGVEVAGSLAEMRSYILPRDYKELNPEEIDIYLIDAGNTLLAGMSPESGRKAERFLEGLDIRVRKNTFVTGYDGIWVEMSDGTRIASRKVIWAAGVTGNRIPGLPEDTVLRNNRVIVDRHCRVRGTDNVYAIGDVAYMEEPAFAKGHPQVAQVAIQQGKLAARNFKLLARNKPLREFSYSDYGSMATIGRNKAVADLPRVRLAGFIAWAIWLWVHLWSLVGVRNKLVVFMNWVINYLTYDPSLRLIIRSRQHPDK